MKKQATLAESNLQVDKERLVASFYHAVENNHSLSAKFLIESFPCFDLANAIGTPRGEKRKTNVLDLAIKNGNISLANALIQHGAEIKSAHFEQAIQYHRFDLFKLFSTKNKITEDQIEKLIICAINNRCNEIVQFLLGKIEKIPSSLIHEAYIHDNVELFAQLLKDCSPMAALPEKNNILYHACKNNLLNMMDYLVRNAEKFAIDINSYSPQGETLLTMIANKKYVGEYCANEQLAFVKRLLERTELDINRTNKNGSLPIEQATNSSSYQPQVLRLFLDDKNIVITEQVLDNLKQTYSFG